MREYTIEELKKISESGKASEVFKIGDSFLLKGKECLIVDIDDKSHLEMKIKREIKEEEKGQWKRFNDVPYSKYARERCY